MNKASDGAIDGEDIQCKEGQCSSGTMRRRNSRITKETHHLLPTIHEDYYGPRTHIPKHH